MTEKINAELSEYLKLLRFKSKASQEIIANRLGITRQTYTLWENNPVNLNLDNLIKICEALEVDVLIFFKNLVAISNKVENENEPQSKVKEK